MDALRRPVDPTVLVDELGFHQVIDGADDPSDDIIILDCRRDLLRTVGGRRQVERARATGS